MTDAEVQVRFLVAWAQTQLQRRLGGRVGTLWDDRRDADPERGDGILVWVIMVALLSAAAIVVVAIIVNKAKSTATNTKTQ